MTDSRAFTLLSSSFDTRIYPIEYENLGLIIDIIGYSLPAASLSSATTDVTSSKYVFAQSVAATFADKHGTEPAVFDLLMASSLTSWSNVRSSHPCEHVASRGETNTSALDLNRPIQARTKLMIQLAKSDINR